MGVVQAMSLTHKWDDYPKWTINSWKLNLLIEFSIYLCSVFPPDARENRKLDYNEIENER